MTGRAFAVAVFAGLALTSFAWAQKMDPPKLDQAGLDMMMKMMEPAVDATPAAKALFEAHRKMQQAMMTLSTGDADRDFISGMIPHHQGAVDMAKVVLHYGRDPEVKKLAEAIIKTQNEEIAWMTAWRSKAGK